MLLCELLQLLYYSLSFLCNFGPIILLYTFFSFKICNCNMFCVNKRLLQKKERKQVAKDCFLENQLKTQWSKRLEVMSEIQATLYLWYVIWQSMQLKPQKKKKKTKKRTNLSTATMRFVYTLGIF